jgi:lipocalin
MARAREKENTVKHRLFSPFLLPFYSSSSEYQLIKTESILSAMLSASTDKSFCQYRNLVDTWHPLPSTSTAHQMR